ncbi:hypothetical protein B0H14DRAFT_2650452 [Mycena olivaceomarginata]|nr:hypothetical protein B0H14DRAFT_2650452 [Mycena olivaceomarginata]
MTSDRFQSTFAMVLSGLISCWMYLDVLAKQEINPSTAQAIVHMNALVLTAYTHSSAGLKQFRKLDQVYEDTLSEDMAEVWWRWDLEEANTELNSMKEFHQGHDMQHEQQKSQWEDQVNELHKEIGMKIINNSRTKKSYSGRNKELDDAYRVTGTDACKGRGLGPTVGRNLWEMLKLSCDEKYYIDSRVKPHQDHGQVLQDEEDIIGDKFTLMKFGTDSDRTLMLSSKELYQDIKHQNGLQEQKNNEIEEVAIPVGNWGQKLQDLDILEEQLAHGYAEPGTVSIGHAVLQRRLADSYHQLHQLQQKHDELQNRWDIQKLVLLQKHNELQNKWDVQRSLLSQKHNGVAKTNGSPEITPVCREQESHKAYQELEGRNARWKPKTNRFRSI